MKKIDELIPEYVEHIPNVLDSSKIYISAKYEIAIHLCACGCGVKSVTPLSKGEWKITGSTEKVTLRPSIGNFVGENPYHAHYYITDSKIEWL